MKIAITGATGLLGSEISRVLSKRSDFEVHRITRKELDLREIQKIVPYFLELKPDLIIHTAAISGVDNCEENREEALLVNWIATRFIREAARKVQADLIYISTDFVFNGKKGNYSELDNPDPINFYGLTKYRGELEVLHYERSYILRVAYLFGKNGKNFLSSFYKVLKGKGVVYGVVDQIGNPTYVPYLAGAILKFVESGMPYGIYHVVPQESTTPFEFFKTFKEISGLEFELKEIEREKLHKKAKRPANTSLKDNILFRFGIKIPGYKEALKEFWEEIRNEF